MKRSAFRILTFSLLLSALSCESEDPIKREQAEMQKRMEGTTTDFYKAFKVALRGTAATGQSESFHDARTALLALAGSTAMEMGEVKKDSSLTAVVSKLFTVAVGLKDAKKILLETDEDTLPTVAENILYVISAGKSSDLSQSGLPWLNENSEHLMLAALWYASAKAPKSFALYELSRTNDDQLGNTDLKLLAKMSRSVIYLREDWPYMSEKAADEYLAISEKEKDYIMQHPWPSLDTAANPSPEAAWHQWRGIGYLLRATARMKMEDKDKEADADLQMFLQEATAGGFDNELTWTVGAYLAVKKEDKEKAALYLGKLEKSSVLSENERKTASEIKGYMNNREPGKALNMISDKMAIAKISGHYISGRANQLGGLAKLEEMDWSKRLLKIVDEISGFVGKIPDASDDMDSGSSDLFD
ncbi:MAG: hypothetical protein FD123_1641 [Bacteroidetes bacterium]|nr:MAG: hypothetical protein FD123_1641 [Bacteroidota bacterium]